MVSWSSLQPSTIDKFNKLSGYKTSTLIDNKGKKMLFIAAQLQNENFWEPFINYFISYHICKIYYCTRFSQISRNIKIPLNPCKTRIEDSDIGTAKLVQQLSHFRIHTLHLSFISSVLGKNSLHPVPVWTQTY